MNEAPLRLALAVALAAAGLAPAGGAAQDWTVSGFFSQRFEADTNIDLDSSGGDPAFGSITDVGLSFRLSGQTTRIVVAPGVRAVGYLDDVNDSNGVLPRLNASFGHDMPRDRFTASLSLIPQTANRDAFDEGDRSESGGLTLAASASLGWEHDIDPRNTLGLEGFARAREPVEGDGASTRSYGADATWSRRLDPRTTGSLIGGFQRFESDDEAEPESDEFSLRLGADHQVNRRLSIGGTGGLSLTAQEGEDTTPGFVGDLRLDYLGRTDSFSLSLSQDVAQDADGVVESRAALSASYAHRINVWSSLGLSARSGFSNPLFGESDSDRINLTISPTYSIDVTRDWSLQLGYALRAEQEDGDTAFSNLVFVEVSRGLSFLP
jgi:hypothetical protein